jgi:hypothetical protein
VGHPPRIFDFRRELLAGFFSGGFEFVAGLPLDQGGLRCSLEAEVVAELRDFCQTGEVHFGAVFIAGLVIVMLDVVFGLGSASGFIVALEFYSFAD